MTGGARTGVWREVRPFVGAAAVIAVYAILRVVHAAVAGSRGVLTPSGALDGTLVALGGALLVTRMAVLIVVPFVVVYRIAMRALARWTRSGAAT